MEISVFSRGMAKKSCLLVNQKGSKREHLKENEGRLGFCNYSYIRF